MKADKDFFENDENLHKILDQLDIDTRESFEKGLEDLYEKLKSKPILNGNELMKIPSEPDNYIVEKLLWQGDIVILLASEKVGKSVFGLQMALALTSCDPFLKEYEVPDEKQVLYIQAEGTREETKERIKSMVSTGEIVWKPKNFFHMYPPALSLDSDEGFDDIVDKIYKTSFNPDVIFIDPLYMAMEGDLIDNKKSRIFCRNIRRLKEKFNCTVVINHHKRRAQTNYKGQKIKGDKKDDDVMGSFVWKAFPSHIINISTRPDGLRSLTCETQRSGTVIQDMQLELKSDPLMFVVHGEPDHAPYVDRVYNYLASSKEPQSADEVILGSGLSKSAVRKSFAFLHKSKKIFKVNPGKRPTRYIIGGNN